MAGSSVSVKQTESSLAPNPHSTTGRATVTNGAAEEEVNLPVKTFLYLPGRLLPQHFQLQHLVSHTHRSSFV